MIRKISLLFLCASTGILAFALLSYWSEKKSPLYKQFESQWAQDVLALEESGKLPPPWFEISELEIIGGTAETRAWLKRIKTPFTVTDKGSHKLEALVVAWEEQGVRGVLIQYNLVELKTGNTVYELNRTLILRRPEQPISVKTQLESLRQ